MTFLVSTRSILVILSCMLVFQTSSADDSLFEDSMSFDVAGQELGDFNDSSDIFEGTESVTKAYPGLGFKLSHKWSANPSDNFETTTQRTELTLDAKGMLPSSGYGELEIKTKRYWPNDSNYSITTSDTQIERAFAQFSSDDLSTKLGKYTIGWGEIEGGALDVVNPAGSLTDPSPESQWLISTTNYWENSNLSFFYNQNPAITKIANVALNGDSNSEFGLRFGLNSEGRDTAFYFARLVPNGAIKDIANGVSYANPYHLLGFSGNQSVGGNLIKYDVAYKSNLEHNRSKLVEVDRLDWGLALDMQKDDMQLFLSMNSQYLIDYYSDLLTPSLTQNVSTRQHNLSYSINVNDSFDDKDYKWNVSASSTHNGDMKLLSAGVDWDINDNWHSSLRGTSIVASPDRAFTLLDGYRRIALEIDYQY